MNSLFGRLNSLERPRTAFLAREKGVLKLGRTWGFSINETERMELERIVVDEDREGALDFLRKIIYQKVKETEKPGSCFHDVNKPLERIERPVRKHKELGDFG